MRWAQGLPATLLLGMAPLLPEGNSGVMGQEQPTRVLSQEESQALKTWARRLLATPPISASGAETVSPEVGAGRLWALYFLAVDHPSRMDDAREATMVLLESDLPREERWIVEALAGALEVVRAKHSRWPPNKLKYLNAGITVLDDLVTRYPEDPGIRYLRLVSCYYLPFFLNREETVTKDFQTLSHLLLRGPGTLPGPVFDAAAEFVLEKGALAPEARKRLEEVLG